MNVTRARRVVINQIEKKANIIADVMAKTSLTPLLNLDYGTLRVYCDAIAQDSDVISIGILDAGKIIKMHTNLNKLGEEVILNVAVSPKEYELVRPIQIRADIVGYIHLVVSTQSALIQARNFSIRTMQVALLVVFVGILISILMSRIITTPINKLAQAAEQISAGDLDRTIDVHSADEVGTLAESFRNMKKELKRHIETRVQSEKMAVIGRLSSSLAHEIRNPLEPIKGAAIMLKNTYSNETLIQKYATVIEEEVETLASFLNSFLDFARTREPVFEWIRLSSIAQQVCDLLQQLLYEKEIDIHTEFAPDELDVYVDPHQIKQVLMNVLLNSIQALPGDGGKIRVSTNVVNKYTAATVVLEVYDNGRGIPEENLGKIFDPFFTSRHDGTGLGLSICQSLMEKNRGRIHIESAESKYTCVRMSFSTRPY